MIFLKEFKSYIGSSDKVTPQKPRKETRGKYSNLTEISSLFGELSWVAETDGMGEMNGGPIRHLFVNFYYQSGRYLIEHSYFNSKGSF